MQAAFFSGSPYLSKSSEVLIPACGVLSSLGSGAASASGAQLLAAMIFALFLPGYRTSSRSAQHVIVAAFYAGGLLCVAAVRSRHRFDCLEEDYSLAEALLWLGIYAAINLQVSSLDLPAQWWGSGALAGMNFPGRSTGLPGYSPGACRPSCSRAEFARRIAWSLEWAQLLRS